MEKSESYKLLLRKIFDSPLLQIRSEIVPPLLYGTYIIYHFELFSINLIYLRIKKCTPWFLKRSSFILYHFSNIFYFPYIVFTQDSARLFMSKLLCYLWPWNWIGCTYGKIIWYFLLILILTNDHLHWSCVIDSFSVFSVIYWICLSHKNNITFFS